MAMAYAPTSRPRACLLMPWLPILLGIVEIITVGIWYHYASKALRDTRTIAELITLELPKAFSSVLPAVMAATLAVVVVTTVCVWALYAWRTKQQSQAAAEGRGPAARAPFVAAAAVVVSLLYGVAVLLMVVFALSLLWMGGGMVASKATMDAASTMSVVDEQIPSLIRTAMNIDPAKGYLIHVQGRDVDIGKSSCSLFCFTLARAMLADTINCTCNPELAATLMPPGNQTAYIPDPEVCGGSPVMCSINSFAYSLYRHHMMPAVVAIVIAVLCVLGLLCLTSGAFARALAEHRKGNISRCSSADADMRVNGSDDGSPKKASMV